MAQTQAQRQEEINKEIALLKKFKLNSFTINRTSFAPFEEVTVAWNTDCPAGLHLELNGVNVANIGSKSTVPLQSITYTLVLKALYLSHNLGTLTATIDETNTIDLGFPAASMQYELSNQLASYLSAYSGVTVRSTDNLLTTDTSGIHIKLKLKMALDNFYDPDIDITLNYTLSIDQSTNPYSIKFHSFGNDVDVSFGTLQDISTLGAAGLLADLADQLLKLFLLNDVSNQIQSALETGINQIAVLYANGITGGAKLYNATIDDGITMDFLRNPPHAPTSTTGGNTSA